MEKEAKKRVGFIVNPVAGMGGSVGLKGTDGPEALRRALSLGATPVSPARARRFLEALKRTAPPLEVYAYPAEMGGRVAKEAGLSAVVIGEVGAETGAEDTVRAAREIVGLAAELVVFVGGDGTARDIYGAVGQGVPVLGVPSGVKMHSAVFARSPEAAAEIAARFLRGELGVREAEVLEADEDAYRHGRLDVRLAGYLKTPYEPALLQGSKGVTQLTDDELENQRAIARYLVERVGAGALYIIGPGTTTRALAEALGVEKTLLGVDVVRDGRVVARDVGERGILEAIGGGEAWIVVTPIGNQGFILGRGNQQISPRVLRRVGRERMIIVATRSKLRGLDALRVDAGDRDLDQALRGFWRVIVDYGEERVVRVE